MDGYTCVANKNPRFSLQTPEELPVSYSFFSTPQVIVRKGDRSAISAVLVHDEVPAETLGIRMQGCRATLDVTFNEPDVNSKAEAEALLASLEADRDEKIRIRDRLNELLQLRAAIDFLRKTGDYFLTELTSAQMTELRTAAISANGPLLTLLTGCDSGISAADRANLTELYGHLWVLGEPAKWRNVDGSAKSLADFMGLDADAILASIRNATQSGSGDGGANLQTEAKAAAVNAERAIARVGQARQQLAAWIG